MLPSEKALAAELKVSVMTLRKALALLEEADRAAARQRNLRVRKSNYHGGELEGFNYQRWWASPTTVTKLLNLRCLMPASHCPAVKDPAGEKVYYVRRLRLIDETHSRWKTAISFATFPAQRG